MSRLQKFRELLSSRGFDAAIITDPMNQRYLSGFDFQDGLVVVTVSDTYLLTDFRYAEAAREQVVKEIEVVIPSEGQIPCVEALLSSHGAKAVAVEEKHLSLSEFLRYEKSFCGQKLTGGASEILCELRLCKDDAELACIERAQRITDAAFAHILGRITPEMTEIEVALELEFFMRREGAEGLAFDTIAVSGTNSARPHGVPRPVRLEKGFLTMDFGARVDGYCSDMTRTVVLGSADSEMKRLYNTVLCAQSAAIDAVAEGTSCLALDKIARDLINGAGYEGCFGHSLGHGVGMLVHEQPALSPRASVESVLHRGHVVTVEPGIYVAGKYGCRIEDMVCIKNDGTAYDFTHSPKELIELF